VPLDGRVLEVGCGHGLLSAYLAISGAAREVVGVDIDQHKIDLAQAAARDLAPGEAHLRFARVEPGGFAEGRWDTIVIADVLYLLDAYDKRALLESMVDHLADGGSVVIKETDVLPRWKAAINRVQEYAATRVLRITQGATLDFEPAAALAAALERMGLDARVERVDRGYPHPHALIVGTRRTAAVADDATLGGTANPPRRTPRDRVARLTRQARVARLTVRRGAHYAVVKVRGVTADADRRAQLEEQFALRTAEDVARELGNMKGAIMKLGQMVSFIADGLPPDAQAALATLQQDVPPMAPSLAERVVREELGEPAARVFLDWDPVPAAAASIGQVHRAVLRDGREVAVKVQYPGVDQAIQHDLDNAEMLYGLFSSVALRNLDVRALVDELRARMHDELDYRIEAACQQQFAARYRGHPFIRVPEVVQQFSSRRVLVTDWADGMGWSEFEQVSSTAQRQDAAEVVFRFAQGSVHRDRVFNGDPHPGNYRFHHDGTVTFLDFGLVKRWSEAEFAAFMPVLDRVLERDSQGVVDGMVAVGFLAQDHGLDPDHVFACVGMPYRAYFDDEFTFTRSYTTEALQVLMDLTGPYADVVRALNMPPGFVILDRVVWGVSALLGRLEATNRWRGILHEYRHGGQPATVLGELEADWRHHA
jgi:predicted unusual protein kinase regulating ubiquinone biosynthesis (AarF/ABC1/UbiB family)/SAM-dependent methyltransferase